MTVKLSNRTVELIKEHLDETGLELPLKGEEDIYTLMQFFTDMEGSLGDDPNANEQLLKDVSYAVDELNLEDMDIIEMNDLNRRLT